MVNVLTTKIKAMEEDIKDIEKEYEGKPDIEADVKRFCRDCAMKDIIECYSCDLFYHK